MATGRRPKPTAQVMRAENAFWQEPPGHFQVEGLAGRMAAERARPEHLDQIRELINQGEIASSRPDYRELARLDWALHGVIGEAARNEVLMTTLLRLLTPFNRLWYMAMADHGRIGNLLNEWREVLAALKKRTPAAAEKALVEHMTAMPSVISPVLSINSTR